MSTPWSRRKVRSGDRRTSKVRANHGASASVEAVSEKADGAQRHPLLVIRPRYFYRWTRPAVPFVSQASGVKAMANPSQSQDVEYTGPKSKPLRSDVAADTGAFVQKVAGAASPSRPMLGKVV